MIAFTSECVAFAQSPTPGAEIRRLDGSSATSQQIDAEVERLMEKGRVPGLAIKLSAGLRSIVFESPSGPAFFKGGHDDWTDNLAVCVPGKGRCVLLLSNSGRAQTIFPSLVKSILGETDLPWSWEYNPPQADGLVPAKE